MTKRQTIVLIIELGLIVAVVYRDQLPAFALTSQRIAYRSCQLAARGFGTLALKLEDNYRVRVAP